LGPTFPDLSGLVYSSVIPGPERFGHPELPSKTGPKPAGMRFIHHYSSFRETASKLRLEKNMANCHMTGADERPGLGFAGRVHEAH